jgi:hypothetical protein
MTKSGDLALPTAIHVLSARRGLHWIADGARLFARQPLLLTAVVSLGWIGQVALAFVPYAGAALWALLAPAVAQGMLCACRSVEAGRPPALEDYLVALRDRAVRIELLRLGLVNLAALTVVVMVWVALAPAQPEAPALPAAASPAGVQAIELPGPEQLLALAVAGALWIPVVMAMWFAPALVAWHGMRASKAMFFSFFACLRNALPFTVFSVALTGAVMVLALFFASIVDLLGLGLGAAQFVLAPLPLLVVALQQAANLRIYREVVRPADPVTEPAAGGPPPAAVP